MMSQPAIHRRGRWLEELPASPWRWLLLPLVLLVWAPYRLGVGLRGIAFDRGWRRVHHVAAPVISIGNLTAGGTGKTPAALAVVARLRARGHRPAIIARGYRALDARGNDEARLAGHTPVICDPDRVAGAGQALHGGATALVLDDGFQHRRLHRDIDIVLIDATRPWGHANGGGAVLPLGYLREGRRGLRRAHLIWISRADLVSPERLQQVRTEIADVAPGVPIVTDHATAITCTPLHASAAEQPLALRSWANRTVATCCAIGNPAAFEATVASTGVIVRSALRFADHHHYRDADLTDALLMADGDPLLITAKDAVKMRDLPASRQADIHVVEQLTTLADGTPLDQLMDRLVSAPAR